MSIAHTLDEALQPRGSLSRLAADLGVSVSYLCEVRKGRRTPSLALALEISRVTGVPVASLVKVEAA
jgi:transcriptional regulator with XRE-family HTH domain